MIYAKLLRAAKMVGEITANDMYLMAQTKDVWFLEDECIVTFRVAASGELSFRGNFLNK